MRTILLWMARNAWLKERVPRLRFVRKAVRRFMPGEDADSAFAAAATLAASGQGILFTRLGENLDVIAEADEVAAHYHAILDRSAALARPIELSVKPTQLGLDIDEEACFGHMSGLAARADVTGTWLWVDMEGSAYVERTIALYERLKAAHRNVGICLQAYLRRTPADLQRLLPLEPAVRLVKGAYDEPAEIAWRRRPGGGRRVPGGGPRPRGCRPRREGAPGARHPRRGARGADRRLRRGRRRLPRPARGPDALRDPGGRAATPAAAPASRPTRSSRTGSTGTRGTCGGSRSGRPTCSSRCARSCRKGSGREGPRATSGAIDQRGVSSGVGLGCRIRRWIRRGRRRRVGRGLGRRVGCRVGRGLGRRVGCRIRRGLGRGRRRGLGRRVGCRLGRGRRRPVVGRGGRRRREPGRAWCRRRSRCRRGASRGIRPGPWRGGVPRRPEDFLASGSGWSGARVRCSLVAVGRDRPARRGCRRHPRGGAHGRDLAGRRDLERGQLERGRCRAG